MLEYDRIDISEGIDVKKTNASKECDIRHYWYFKDIGFKCEPYLCNGCHGLMKKCLQNSLLYMSKDDAISIMNNSNLNNKMGVLYFIIIIIIIIVYKNE